MLYYVPTLSTMRVRLCFPLLFYVRFPSNLAFPIVIFDTNFCLSLNSSVLSISQTLIVLLLIALLLYLANRPLAAIYSKLHARVLGWPFQKSNKPPIRQVSTIWSQMVGY